MSSKKFNILLRSNYRSSGTPQDANYIIPFETVLPQEYDCFNLKCRFVTEDFLYEPATDPRGVEVRIDMNTATRTYDTLNNTTSKIVHFAYIKDVIDNVGNSTVDTVLVASYEDFTDGVSHIVYRPQNNILNVKCLNMSSVCNGTPTSLLLNKMGNICPDYNLYLEFTPISSRD